MTWQWALWIVASGLGTAVGAAALLVFRRRPGRRLLDALLGFTAGVMAAAVSFSLIVPGLDRGSWVQVAGGFLLGAGFLLLLDVLVPHAHAEFAERGRLPLEQVAAGRRAVMLLSALTIHNHPSADVRRQRPPDDATGRRARSVSRWLGRPPHRCRR